MLKALAAASSGLPLASSIAASSQHLWQQGVFHSSILRRRLGPLRAILTFALIVLALESRRQQRRLSVILLALLSTLQRSLGPWQERWTRLKRRKGGYRALWAGRGGGKPFSAVFFWGGAGDEDGSGNATLTAGDGEGGPFTRRVMLGDRGRARCSWMVRQQFLRHAYCDVTFVVEGQAFPAHRCWVAAFSMPLCAMFNSGMRESQESRITLRDTDAGAFELMLNFIYGGPVELSQENIECVLELSVRFAVGMLIEQCCNFLASAVAVDTACAILILADKYDCRPLRRDALLFVVAHFPRCWATAKPHFARLPRFLLLEVLSHDGLAHGEIVTFKAAVYWLEEWRRTRPLEQDEAEKEEEERLVEEVLGQVRFPHMPACLLVEEVEGHPIMQAEACQRFVLEAYRYQAVVQRGQQPQLQQLQYQQQQGQQEQQGHGQGHGQWLQLPQQELLKKYALEMGVRSRPRRKLTGGVSQCLLLAGTSSSSSNSSSSSQWPELLEEEEKWGEELLLPGEGGGWVRCSSSSSSIGRSTAATKITNHRLLGRVEEIEPQVAGCDGGRAEMGTERTRTASYSLISTTTTIKTDSDHRIAKEEGSSSSSSSSSNHRSSISAV